MTTKDFFVIIGSILGGGSLVGVVAFFVSPASERLAARRKNADSRTFLTAGIVALSAWGDTLRERVLGHEPGAQIEKSNEVLQRARSSLDVLN